MGWIRRTLRSSSTVVTTAGAAFVVHACIIGGTPVPGSTTTAGEVVRVHQCGGTLIAPDVVVSAAHCPGPGPTAVVGRPDLDVTMDSMGLAIGADVAIVSVHDHPMFGGDPGVGNPDVRVIRLAEPAVDGSGPLPFARIGPLAAMAAFVPLTAMGYGTGRILNEVELFQSACGGGGITFCTTDGHTCAGDSGGPVFQSTGSPKILAGIISAGMSGGCIGSPADGLDDIHSNAFNLQSFIPGPHGDTAPGAWTELGPTCDLAASDAAGYGFPSSYPTWQAADVNGDGRDDIVVRDLAGAGVDTFFSNGDGTFVAPASGADNNPPWGDDVIDSAAYLTMQSGDFNADGRADLLIRHPVNGIEIYLSQFDGMSDTWVPWAGDPVLWNNDVSPLPYDDVNGWGDEELFATIQTGDVDGDGFADIFSVGPSGAIIHRNDQMGGWEVVEHNPPIDDALGDPGYFGTYLLADVVPGSGDELIERTPCGLRVWQRGASLWAEVRVPDCSDPMEWNSAAFDEPSRWATLQTANIDGDGCLDLIGRGPEFLRVLRSRCDPSLPLDEDIFAEVVVPTVRMPDNIPLNPPFPGWDRRESYGTVQAGDVNGDGFDDIIGRGPSGIETWIGDGTGEFQPADPHHPFWGDLHPRFPSVAFPGETWAAARFATTILLANLDGAATTAVQLIGRQACGAETWHFVGP
jgi:Trypsin/FG-GAP-like repeat